MKLLLGLVIGFSLGTVSTLGAGMYDDPFTPSNPADAWQRDYDQKLHRSTELQFQNFLQHQQLRQPC